MRTIFDGAVHHHMDGDLPASIDTHFPIEIVVNDGTPKFRKIFGKKAAYAIRLAANIEREQAALGISDAIPVRDVQLIHRMIIGEKIVTVHGSDSVETLRERSLAAQLQLPRCLPEPSMPG